MKTPFGPAARAKAADDDRRHQPAAQVAIVQAPGAVPEGLQAVALQLECALRLAEHRAQEVGIEVLAAARRGGIRRRREAPVMTVDVLDRELGVERDGEQPAPGHHRARIGRAVGELVPDVRAERGERDAGREDGAEPVPGRGRLAAREQVEAEVGLRPRAETEQVARACHPCHRDPEHEQGRQREIQQRVQQPRMTVGRFLEIVAERFVAQDHDAVDHDETEPHPGAAQQDAGQRGEREQVNRQEPSVLDHGVPPGTG